MSQQTPPTNQKTWFIIFFALVASIGTYGLLCFFVTQNPTRPISPTLATMRPFFIALAVAALMAAVAWLRFRVDGQIGGEGRPVTMSPAQFQTGTIIALALSEACAIFGLVLFFLGAPLGEFALFALGSVFVDLAFVLPRGIQFWATQK